VQIIAQMCEGALPLTLPTWGARARVESTLCRRRRMLSNALLPSMAGALDEDSGLPGFAPFLSRLPMRCARARMHHDVLVMHASIQQAPTDHTYSTLVGCSTNQGLQCNLCRFCQHKSFCRCGNTLHTSLPL